jgi:hypothetical protein
LDPRQNPFAPGAGTPPPELAGRGLVLDRTAITLDRIRSGRAAQSLVLYGLRGVGKTVLLNQIRRDGEARGLIGVWIEMPEDRNLPEVLVPALRSALIKLSRGEAAKASIARALRALAAFARTFRVTYNDVEFGMGTEPGLADSGDLDADLADLIAIVGEAARDRRTAVVLYIDEIQYVQEPQLAALIMAIHAAGQAQLPVTAVAAGLPQILGKMGRAKSYAERLFEFVSIDRLDLDAARQALRSPIEREDVLIDDDALEEIVTQTQGYPYFLQKWGQQAWDVAKESPIRLGDVRQASSLAIADLDDSFFRVRFDRLTPREKLYLQAMGELGPGPHRSGDIAKRLGRPVTSEAPTRMNLIAKGMIYSPAHGDNAFTVPLFDAYMRRIMPMREA